jgi:hypothetical protein
MMKRAFHVKKPPAPPDIVSGMSERPTLLPDVQRARSVLMVRPASFGFNQQTSATNAFQQHSSSGAQIDQQGLALREFDGLAGALQRAGVEVIVAADSVSPVKPDAVFPNNWVSFHPDGTVVLYPMLALNRRLERREELIAQVARDGAFRITRTVDLSYREEQHKFLEGTGSMVLDRAQQIAYACISPRTDLDVLGEFAQQLDYELATFEAFDSAGRAVYHTNVVMAVGGRFAVVCGEAIAEPQHREAVLAKLRATGHEVIDITLTQMHQFGGNILELAPRAGSVIAMSTTAWRSFDAAQRRTLESHGDIVAAAIPTIETFGGGGVRCMLAEIHLPKRS